jgi:hypothetical protein
MKDKLSMTGPKINNSVLNFVKEVLKRGDRGKGWHL